MNGEIMSDLEFLELDLDSSKKGKKGWKPEYPDLEKKTYKKRFGENLRNWLEKFLLFSCLLAFFEIIFHLWAFGKVDACFALKVFLCFPTGAFLSLFSSFFGKIANRIISWLIIIVMMVYFLVNILYHAIFKVFFSIMFVDKTNMKVVQYYREILQGISDNIGVVLLTVFIPLLFIILLKRTKVLRDRKVELGFIYIPLTFIALLAGGCFLLVPAYGKDTFSPYDLIVNINTNEVSFNKLGVLATTEIEAKNILFPQNEYEDDEEYEPWEYVPKVVRTEAVDEEDKPLQRLDNKDTQSDAIDVSPNILDLDFIKMAEEEENSSIASIHKYFSSIEPSYKNKYTGMFKGYNVIFLTAEGFSTWAIDEKLTPTLYKLSHEGIVCNNFYNPRTGGSTSDGEFVCSTSLVPVIGGAKNFRTVGHNYMPFTLGNMMNEKYGIQSRAYHDNDYMYYGRDVTYPRMGYYYQGVGNGLKIGKHWPESDLEMMEASIPEYIDDDLFCVYYMTVSGHLNYNFNGNWCSQKHRDEVADLPYSDACKAYIACNMELDLALEHLLNELEAKGIADRTVIVFTGDHWPYGLTNEQISEFLDHPVETNFELFKSSLILWSASIKEPIYVDKQCCSMDILPTMLNLLGMDYDSRLLMGRDIMSDTEGFVMFINRSFITDKLMYNSLTGKVTYLTEEELPEGYLDDCKKTLSNRFKYSGRIMENDYYKYICKKLNIDLKESPQNYVPDYTRTVNDSAQ